MERHFGIEEKVIHDAGALWDKSTDCNHFEVDSNQISEYETWYMEFKIKFILDYTWIGKVMLQEVFYCAES